MPLRSRPAPLVVLLLAACGPAPASVDTGPHYATSFTEVTLDATASAPFALAVEACAGLQNRALGGSVYVTADESDADWLPTLGLAPAQTLSAEDYLTSCLTDVHDCVRYDYASQHAILPAILTAASALGAVPMDTGVPGTCGNVVLDATSDFAGLDTPEAATRHVFEAYGADTTGLAMLNPGFDPNTSDPSNPPLTLDMPPDTVDFVFSERLFALFLVNGCIAGNPENTLLDEIVNAGNWATPLPVYGYNDSWLVGGYLYEAQTRCLDSRNMGAIASKTGNLSFFSTRRAPITSSDEVVPDEAESVDYDPGTTFVAFVVGDGDNVDYVLSKRNTWIEDRLSTCATTPDACPPLTWSLSPHLPTLAPDILDWYSTMSHQTGKDWFTLPPSGDLYAYPSSFDEDDQARFAAATEADARLYGVHGTVHWDWFDSWDDALATFLPRYADAGVIQGVVPVNVPYTVDPFPDWPPDQEYTVLDGAVVVFRPHEWRGVDGADEFTPTPQQMADTLAAAPPGSVMAVYMTSDGGLDLANSLEPLTALLPATVRLVGLDTASRLALEASGE